MKRLKLLLGGVLLLSIQTAKCQSNTENKKVVLRYLEEIVNHRRLDLLEEVFAEKFLRHDLLDSTEKVLTVADQKQGLSELFNAFPDLYYTIGDVIAEGDRVSLRAVFHGTHKGKFMGVAPSGNRIDYLSEIFFFRLEKGKIIERWVQLDLYNLFKKMKGEK